MIDIHPKAREDLVENLNAFSSFVRHCPLLFTARLYRRLRVRTRAT